MKFKLLSAVAITVAILFAAFCIVALMQYTWSRRVIKLKQEEGWSLVAIVNSVDFIHPWNNFTKPGARIWFVKPDTFTHVNQNIVAFRALTVDYDGSVSGTLEDTPVVAFDCTDKKTAIVVPPEFRPSKFQWRNYEVAFTAHIAKIACP